MARCKRGGVYVSPVHVLYYAMVTRYLHVIYMGTTCIISELPIVAE